MWSWKFSSDYTGKSTNCEGSTRNELRALPVNRIVMGLLTIQRVRALSAKDHINSRQQHANLRRAKLAYMFCEERLINRKDL